MYKVKTLFYDDSLQMIFTKYHVRIPKGTRNDDYVFRDVYDSAKQAMENSSNDSQQCPVLTVSKMQNKKIPGVTCRNVVGRNK